MNAQTIVGTVTEYRRPSLDRVQRGPVTVTLPAHPMTGGNR